MSLSALSLPAASPDETRAIGERLGRTLQVSDAVGLVGPLGAGKTTFAQGIAAGAGVPADRHVASPTFALVNEHQGRVLLVHADLYRVADSDELAELGLDDAFDRAAVVIEWIDRFPDLLPPDHLMVTIERPTPQERRMRFEATGPRGRALIDAVAT